VGAGVDFQPSVNTLKRYLSTHKDPMPLGGVTLPGLFSDARTVDWGWFILAVVAELGTAAVLSLILVKAFNLPIFAFPLGLIAFIGFDLVAAIFHHWPVKKHRCLFHNRRLLVVPSLRSGDRKGEVKYGDFLAQLKAKDPTWPKVLSGFCAVVIVCLAILKTLLLSANIDELGELAPTSASAHNPFASRSTIEQVLKRDEYRYAVLGVFALLYGVIAFIHLNHTGWAVSAAQLSKGLRADRHRRDADPRDPKFKRQERKQQINLRSFANELLNCEDPVYSPLAPQEAADIDRLVAEGLYHDLSAKERKAISPHTIEADGSGSFTMIRRGVLEDEQLTAWVDMQKSEFAKLAVALYGHKLQLDTIGATDIDQRL
jgi:hypothetical protein